MEHLIHLRMRRADTSLQSTSTKQAGSQQAGLKLGSDGTLDHGLQNRISFLICRKFTSNHI
jgi:hypothetical protein